MIAAAVLALLTAAVAPPAACPATPPARAEATVASRVDAHRASSASQSVAFDPAPPAILIYGEGGHLATQRYSIVATRTDAGLWHVDARGDTKIWVKGASAHAITPVVHDLDAQKSAEIDAILADPCLWRAHAAVNRDGSGPPPLGLIPETLEILMPDRTRRVSVLETADGPTARLMALVRPD